MRLLARIVDTSVIGFAAWTIAYHVVFFTRLPAVAVFPFWALLGLGAWRFFARRGRPPMDWGKELRSAGPSLVVGVLLAASSAFLYMPFLDNFSFLHRAFWQMGHLREPFNVHFTGLTASNLPPLSESHLMTSVEMMGALFARILHLDPLWVCFNLLPAGVALVSACAVGLVGRFLRLRPGAVVLLLVGFVLASYLNASVLRSIGMFGLPRLSEGKCDMAFAGMPLALLYLLRFTRTPSLRHWVLLVAMSICFVGWTSSGILSAPVVLLLAALSFGIASFASSKRSSLASSWRDVAAWFRGAFLPKGLIAPFVLFSGFYPVFCYALAKASFIPPVHDTSVWVNDWPANWLVNIRLIANGGLDLFLQLNLITVGILLVARRENRWICWIPILLEALIFNPIAGPIAIHIIPAGIFWRVGYIAAFPIGLGLCLAAVMSGPIGKRGLGFALVALVVCVELPVVRPGVLEVRFGSPLQPKWWPEDLAAASAVREQITEPRLLAPERVACILALMDPSLKFDSVRAIETRHLYRNSPLGARTGQDCALAEEYIDGTTSDPSGFDARIGSGLRQIVVRDRRLALVSSEVKRDGFGERISHTGPFYDFIQVVPRK